MAAGLSAKPASEAQAEVKGIAIAVLSAEPESEAQAEHKGKAEAGSERDECELNAKAKDSEINKK